jgi:hypothetical protein
MLLLRRPRVFGVYSQGGSGSDLDGAPSCDGLLCRPIYFLLFVDDVPRVWDTGEGGHWRGDHMCACTMCVLVTVLGSLVPADGSGLSAVCGVSMSVRVIVCMWWMGGCSTSSAAPPAKSPGVEVAQILSRKNYSNRRVYFPETGEGYSGSPRCTRTAVLAPVLLAVMLADAGAPAVLAGAPDAVVFPTREIFDLNGIRFFCYRTLSLSLSLAILGSSRTYTASKVRLKLVQRRLYDGSGVKGSAAPPASTLALGRLAIRRRWGAMPSGGTFKAPRQQPLLPPGIDNAPAAATSRRIEMKELLPVVTFALGGVDPSVAATAGGSGVRGHI